MRLCLNTVTTPQFVPGTIVMIGSFLDHNPWFDGDIRVVVPRPIKGLEARLRHLWPRLGVTLPDPTLHRTIRSAKNLSQTQAVKLCALDILRPTPYDRTLFLDSDLLVCGDVKELACAEAPLAACPEAASLRGMCRDRASFRIASHGIKNAFNSGVMSLSAALSTPDTYAKACNLVGSEFWRSLGTGHADQAVLNIMFEGQQKLFPPDFNFLLQHEISSVAKLEQGTDRIRVFHFGLQPKPWQAEPETLSMLARSAWQSWKAEDARLRPRTKPVRSRFVGADRELAQQINTHLFLLCPNSSGSTFLGNALSRSSQIWSLPREGQHVLGYAGPNTRNAHQLIWAADPEVLARFQDPTRYDWNKIRKAWYFQARAEQSDASVFFTKAPPFLAIPEALAAAFSNTRFLIMTRDPYAVVESIFRFYETRETDPNAILERACAHVLRCLALQDQNMRDYADISVHFTYETLCADPVHVASKIENLVPTLTDLDLSAATSVKARYFEPVRNMNDQQIDRLTKDQIARITQAFAPHTDLLNTFGYDLMP